MSQPNREFKDQVLAAYRHLRDADETLADVIARVGPCTMKLRRLRFASLVRAIVGQQISTKAAARIYERLIQAVRPQRITAERLAIMNVEQLRELGFSNQKASYILDLATKIIDRSVRFDKHRRWDDQRVVDDLVQVRGIGVWTAEMYLMFSLGRPDVFPVDDWGLQTAMKKLYGSRCEHNGEQLSRTEMKEIAESWRPYRTIASWYCWRSLSLPDEKTP